MSDKNGYTKEEAQKLVQKMTDLVDAPISLIGYNKFGESVESMNKFEKTLKFSNLITLYKKFRQIKPKGRFGIIVIIGEELPNNGGTAHIYDSQILDKAFGK